MAEQWLRAPHTNKDIEVHSTICTDEAPTWIDMP